MNTSTTKELVVLELLGIDKKWVRSEGQWVDQATMLQTRHIQPAISEDKRDMTRKKWWKFWAR